jgi:hypothetical protein
MHARMQAGMLPCICHHSVMKHTAATTNKQRPITVRCRDTSSKACILKQHLTDVVRVPALYDSVSRTSSSNPYLLQAQKRHQCRHPTPHPPAPAA